MWRAGLAEATHQARLSTLACLVGAALLCLATFASASSAGPPPARTGGFGEMTCHECHWDNPVNDPAGSLMLSGIPASYTPGEAYTITVSVAHSDTTRAGFQLSARSDAANATAGQLRASDATTRTVVEKGITYVSQADAGSKKVTNATATWTVEWRAPASGEPVIFHVAGNAANGDASPLGDYVYTATATSTARQP
jgi:hypothetical protein